MRENLSVASSIISSSPLTSRVRTMNEQPSFHCDSSNDDNGRQNVGTGGAISSFEQRFRDSQAPSFTGSSVHVSMADIVKMGRPRAWDSYMADETSNTLQDTNARDSLHCFLKVFHDSSSSPSLGVHQDLQCPHPASVPKTLHQSDNITNQHNFDGEWPAIEQQADVSRSSILSSSTTSSIGMLPNQCHLFDDGINLPKNSQPEVQVSERNVACKILGSNCFEFDSPSNGWGKLTSARGASHSNDGSLKDMISYDSHGCMNELHEGREICSHDYFANGSAPLNDIASSTAVSLQQLSLGKEAKFVRTSEDDCALVFPNDIHTLGADCSHLSFGTYKSGVHAASSVPLASKPSKSNMEPSAVIDRNLGYVGESQCSEQVGYVSEIHQLNADGNNHNLSVSSQPELMTQDIDEVNSGYDYMSSKSVSDSCFKNIQKTNSPSPVVRSPCANNVHPLHRELQVSSTPVPVDSLTSVVQFVGGSDCAHSYFPGTQSLTSKYNDIVSSAGIPTIPMAEIMCSGAFSLPKSHSSTLPGVGLGAGHVLPQHLIAHPQSTLSWEELIYLSGSCCSAVPQTYPCTPTAFQQAYQDSSANISVLHDHLAGMKYNLQHLKCVSPRTRSSLPLFSANISGYGGLENPSNLSGRFLDDLSAAPNVGLVNPSNLPTTNGSAVGYNAFLHAQYKEGNNFAMLQQVKDYGHGSRTLSAFPDNGYYNLDGQDQLLSTYQQLSQNYVRLGSANANHSQQRISRDEQQSLGDLAFRSSQVPSKQLHPVWQHIY
ncbi:uncharacterized protein LOC110600676 isoform X4 [Manihot esculenta]|nr:uncharacterized protein LOC110600676 isoform X4 [Manihot esculenta]